MRVFLSSYKAVQVASKADSVSSVNAVERGRSSAAVMKMAMAVRTAKMPGKSLVPVSS